MAEQNHSDAKSIRDNENQALLRETFSCVIKIVSISPRAIFQAKSEAGCPKRTACLTRLYMLFRLLIGKLRILHTALSAADFNMTAIHVARGIRGQKYQYLSQVLRRTEAAARDVCQQRITVLLNALRSDLCCDHARHIGHSTRILAAANSAAMDALRFFTAAFAALYVARPALGSSAAKEEAFKITPPPCAFMYG